MAFLNLSFLTVYMEKPHKGAVINSEQNSSLKAFKGTGLVGPINIRRDDKGRKN